MHTLNDDSYAAQMIGEPHIKFNPFTCGGPAGHQCPSYNYFFSPVQAQTHKYMILILFYFWGGGGGGGGGGNVDYSSLTVS